MKLEEKIYGSIGLTVFLTIAYYYAYSFVDLYISKLCDKYVCFEFPPYADLLSIWVAVVGLYFVVDSLDAWKMQDKYLNSKKSMEYIQLINEQMKYIGYKLNNFYPKDSIVLRNEELDFIKKEFKKFINETEVFENYNHLDRNNYINNKLFKSEIEGISKKLSKIIFGIDHDVRNIKEIEPKTEKRFKGDLVNIHIKYRNDISNVSLEIQNLNKLIKDFSL